MIDFEQSRLIMGMTILKHYDEYILDVFPEINCVEIKGVKFKDLRLADDDVVVCFYWRVSVPTEYSSWLPIPKKINFLLIGRTGFMGLGQFKPLSLTKKEWIERVCLNKEEEL